MQSYKLKINLLLAALQCAGKKDVRFYLNGVCYKDGHLVGTDGHTAVVIESGIAEPGEFIFPRETVEMIGKILGKKHQALELEFQVGGLKAKALLPGQAIEFSMVDGKFPDYRRILPEDGHHHKEPGFFDPALLLQIEKAAQLMVCGSRKVLTRVWHRGEANAAHVSGPGGFRAVVMPIRA